MDWASWVSDVIAVAALVTSVIFGRQSGAAKRTALEAQRQTASMAQSLESIAGSLASRTDRAGNAIDRTSAPLLPAFTLEAGGGAAYRLRNSSAVDATDVRLRVPAGYQVSGYEEVVVSHLGPAQSITFYMTPEGDYDNAPIGEIEVTCSELETPRFVPIP